MELKKVSTSCYYSTSEDFGDRPCLGYIKTSCQTGIMIDAGNSEKQAQEFSTLLQKNNLPTPTLCVITHSHWDHTMGMSYFKLTPFVATPKAAKKIVTCNKDLIDNAIKVYSELPEDEGATYKENLDTETKYCLEKFWEEHCHAPKDITIVAPTFATLQSTINIPSIYTQIKVFPLTESLHSEDALVILAVDEKVLYVGDALYRNMNGSGKFTSTLGSILYKRIKSIDFNTCILGHSRALTKEETLKFIKNSFKS